MRILGIETSCDETAICLIEASGSFGPDFVFRVLGNALLSQIDVHAPWGGVFPNLAKREHAKNVVPLLERVLATGGELRPGRSSPPESSLRELLAREPELFERLETFLSTHKRPNIDAIAVTHGPGLPPALWVGVNFAKALGLVWDVPIAPVNHLEGHVAMAAVEDGRLRNLTFPAIALLISGGHTELDLLHSWPHFKAIGQTRDDAVGEAFDKIARMLGIPYPGGAKLSDMAARARSRGGNAQFRFSRPMLNQDNFDFSFSGLKTEVRKHVPDDLPEPTREEIARGFEDAATDVLVGKTARAVEEFGAQTVLAGGGVSANAYIRERLKQALDGLGVTLLAPPPEWATDNALMIALAGYFRASNKEFADPAVLRADGNLRLAAN